MSTPRLAAVPLTELHDAAMSLRLNHHPSAALVMDHELDRRRRVTGDIPPLEKLRSILYDDALQSRTLLTEMARQLERSGEHAASAVAARLASDYSPLLTALRPPGSEQPVFACKR